MNSYKDSKNKKNKKEFRLDCPVDEYCHDFLNNDSVSEYNMFIIQKPHLSDEEEISEIRCQIKTDDDPGTKLVKKLINLIYTYESDIVNHIRKIGKEHEFQIKLYESRF